MFSSRHFKILFACFTLLAPGLSAAERPNVVFILADDLGARDLGCYGSTFYKTPNIDALARRGMRFSNAYAASPICSPTRAAIMTGLSPARIGITSPSCHLPGVLLVKSLANGSPATRVLNAASLTRLKTDYLTLPEVLLKEGYRTGHFGKWHLGAEPYSPLQHGFEVDIPHSPAAGPGGVNGYFAPWSFWKDQGKTGDHIEDRMADEAVAFIRANKDRPFFLNYWAFSVHAPWMAKDGYVAEAAKRALPDSPHRNPVYAGMVRSLDDAVGKLTAILDQLNLTANTIIVFTSDNGGWSSTGGASIKRTEFAGIPVTSNAPFRSGKASNYEGGTRVPLMVAWPDKIAANSTSDAIVQSMDFFPTLAGMTHSSLPADTKFDGISIAPALRGEPLNRDAIYSHFPHGDHSDIDGFKPGTWVRRGDWKLIRFYGENDDGTDKLELYNLRNDISEKNNLASTYPQLVIELNALITGYLAETKAVVPVRNPKYDPAIAKKALAVRGAPDAAPDAGEKLKGWQAHHCRTTLKDGILTVTPDGAPPFLGVSVGRSKRDTVLKLRLRSAVAGAGKIEWLPSKFAVNATKDKSVPFRTAGAEWRDVSVTIPADDLPGILRVHVPAGEKPTQIDWVELKADGNERRWDF